MVFIIGFPVALVLRPFVGEDFALLIGVLVVFGLVLYETISDTKETKKQAEDKKVQEVAFKNQLKKVPDFSPSAVLKTGKWAIVLDDSRKKLLLVNDLPVSFTTKIVDYSDVFGSEVIEDGVTVTATKTNRGSQLVGAAVGTALAGVGGLIVGGLSASSTSTSQSVVSSVKLRIILNDTVTPERVAEFLVTPVPKGSAAHRVALDNARHWHGIFEVLIKRADNNARFTGRSSSVADELKKLLDLKNAGVLSDDEFAREKGKLLKD